MKETKTLELLTDTTVCGRTLCKPAREPGAPTIFGFHGYAENAEVQLARLEQLVPTGTWNLVSIQALYAFYNRSGEVVASWMTKQNRERAICNNLNFIAAVLEEVRGTLDLGVGLLFAGFSQGTSMAYRAAAGLDETDCLGVLAVGGDIPPELTENDARKIKRAVHARGSDDERYPPEQLSKDLARLDQLGVASSSISYSGHHEWNSALCEALAEPLKRFLA